MPGERAADKLLALHVANISSVLTPHEGALSLAWITLEHKARSKLSATRCHERPWPTPNKNKEQSF